MTCSRSQRKAVSDPGTEPGRFLAPSPILTSSDTQVRFQHFRLEVGSVFLVKCELFEKGQMQTQTHPFECYAKVGYVFRLTISVA